MHVSVFVPEFAASLIRATDVLIRWAVEPVFGTPNRSYRFHRIPYFNATRWLSIEQRDAAIDLRSIRTPLTMTILLNLTHTTHDEVCRLCFSFGAGQLNYRVKGRQ